MSIHRPATIILALFIATLTSAQNREELHCIGFYNLENLFDTIHDAGKNDYEFLPKGANRWNSETDALQDKVFGITSKDFCFAGKCDIL